MTGAMKYVQRLRLMPHDGRRHWEFHQGPACDREMEGQKGTKGGKAEEGERNLGTGYTNQLSVENIDQFSVPEIDRTARVLVTEGLASRRWPGPS
jgi:hypothetical protein